MDCGKVIHQFFAMVSLRQFDWGEALEPDNLTIDEQQCILQKTLLSHLCCEFPPSLKYRQLFTKRILKQCEDLGIEAAEELYEVYSSLVSQKEGSQDNFFKSYKLPSGSWITLRESGKIVSDGTTGLRSWPAGQFIVEWASEKPSSFADKTILELGSGLGLTGLCLCSVSRPASYIFSDCHYQVLKTLQENISLNMTRNHSQQSLESQTGGKPMQTSANHSSLECIYTQQRPGVDICDSRLVEGHDLIHMGDWCHKFEKGSRLAHSGSAETQTEGGRYCHVGENKVASEGLLAQDLGQVMGSRTQVKMCCIDWETVQRDWLWSLNVDVILAADVIYDSRLIPALIQVLCTLLNPHGPQRAPSDLPVAYIASTIRNEDTYKLFLDLAANADLSCEEMSPPRSHFFHFDRSCSIQILKLKHNGGCHVN